MNPHRFFKKQTLNLAHRGFTANAPENSLAAFREALALGADGLELDVRTCKSGEVIVFHDPTLARMTDGRGFVKNKTLAELKQLRLQSKYAEYDEEIPTLEEVIKATGKRVRLNIEIKTNGLPNNTIERRVVEIIRKHGIENKTIVSSFNPLVIRRIRKIDDEILKGYLIDKNFNVRRSEIFLTKMAGAEAVHIEKSLATNKLVKKIQEFGFYCIVWSVNDKKMMRRLTDLGVNGIITDRSDILKNLTHE